MKKVIGALAAFLLSTSTLLAATLLPNGQQQFIDGNGKPYAGGKVWFYSDYPYCTVLKNTWFSPNASPLTQNNNPVTLDAAGRATIFGSGSYCQVLKDSLGNTIWSKYTEDLAAVGGFSWGTNAGGTANAQTVTSATYSGIDGQTIYFEAAATNTGSTTLAVSGNPATQIVKPTPNGVQFLTGGEIVAGNVVGVTYVQSLGQFQLVTNNAQLFGATSNLAAAATTNLNSVASHVVNVTGTGVTITSFGSGGASAQVNSAYIVRFDATNTITYNATSMITPLGQDLVVQPNDSIIAVYLGGSNWQIVSYQPSGLISTNSQTGTTYTVLASDRGKLVSLNNASGVAVSVPAATSGAFTAGYTTLLQNAGGFGNVTITPSSGTIGGQSSIILAPGNGIRIISDGTNWRISGTIANATLLPATTITGSPASVEFTDIPPWVKRITITFNALLTAGTGDYRIQLGTGPTGSITYITSGYLSFSARQGSSAEDNVTDGFNSDNAGSTTTSMVMVINRAASGSYVETQTGTTYTAGTPNTNIFRLTGSGTVSGITNPVTAVRITNNPATTYTSGVISLMYE